MKTLLIIDPATNKVVNSTVAWEPPEGCIAVENEKAGIGWAYNPEDGSFTPPDGIAP